MHRSILRPSAPFLVGANYWASHAAHRMWERWDAAVVEKDLALAESMGLNALRTFFWSPELNPLPGVVSEQVLARFAALLEIAGRHRIGIFPTFFVGHMSGTDWDMPWRQGRDFCADPFMVYWETDLVRRVVARFRGHPAVLGWILTNELPNYTGSLPPETATMWTRAMHQAVKEADPSALVSTGDGARCEVRTDYDGFRVEWVKDHVDWIGVHLYNYFAWEAGDCDELRKSYHIPCRLRYVDVGRPVLLEEFGTSDLISGREEAAGYYRSVLWSSLANGACGALAWCLTDFDLSDEVPYAYQPHELTYGFATAKHEIKGQGRVLAEFAGLSRELRFDELQMEQPDEAIWVPYAMYEDLPHHGFDRLRGYRALEQSFTLAKMAGLNPDFARRFDELAGHRLLILPAGARLKAPEWARLERWVREGGSVFYVYAGLRGGVYAQNFEALFGCRQRIRFGQLEQPEADPVRLRVAADFGGLARGRRDRAAHRQARPRRRVPACAGRGRAGAGRGRRRPARPAGAQARPGTDLLLCLSSGVHAAQYARRQHDDRGPPTLRRRGGGGGSAGPLRWQASVARSCRAAGPGRGAPRRDQPRPQGSRDDAGGHAHRRAHPAGAGEQRGASVPP